MQYLIDFTAAPEPGTVVTLDKCQHYELIAVDPYTRRDGASSAILTWRVRCHDCGQPFEIKTGLRSKNWNRRCQSCKAPLHRIAGFHRKRKRVDVRICTPSDLF